MNYGCGGNSKKFQMSSVDSAIILVLNSSFSEFLWERHFLTNFPIPQHVLFVEATSLK